MRKRLTWRTKTNLWPKPSATSYQATKMKKKKTQKPCTTIWNKRW